MSNAPPPATQYDTHAAFLAGDHRRHGDALELGHDWREGAHRYRVCWYQQTGELTLERLSPHQRLKLEDFHHGVTGPTEILAHIPSRQELGHILGDWPTVAPHEPRTTRWLRARLRRAGAAGNPNS
jgi:hypothetical protein